MEFEPASIWFMPVCSKCGKILQEPVGIEYSETLLPKEQIIKHPLIYPSHCPFCGTPFEQIIMARDLPFEGY